MTKQTNRLERQIGKYLVTISTKPYTVIGMYEHEIVVAKIGTYFQTIVTVHNKRKYYEPFNLYEEVYFLVDRTESMMTEIWEDGIRKMDEDYKKLKYSKKV